MHIHTYTPITLLLLFVKITLAKRQEAQENKKEEENPSDQQQNHQRLAHKQHNSNVIQQQHATTPATQYKLANILRAYALGGNNKANAVQATAAKLLKFQFVSLKKAATKVKTTKTIKKCNHNCLQRFDSIDCCCRCCCSNTPQQSCT